jgi:hypothetical protein
MSGNIIFTGTWLGPLKNASSSGKYKMAGTQNQEFTVCIHYERIFLCAIEM